VFGPDANYYNTIGNGGVADGSSDFNVKQAYVALRAPVGNGLDIKLGVWDTLIGYEVFESVNNPNFSRSYGYFIEPTHHTGLMLSYKVNDWLSASGAVANGWTGGINDKIHSGSGNGEARKAVMGSLTITLPDSAGALKGSAIYAGMVYGDSTASVQGGVVGNETSSYYAGATLNTPIEGLSFGAAFDYRVNGPIVTAGGLDNYAWAGAVYVSFAATEKLKLNARGEYAKGSSGTWYTGGNNNELGAVTLTADYSLWANVITRGEVRWDHNLGGDPIYNGIDADRDIVTLTANIVYKF